MSFYCNGKKGICDKIKNSHGVCPLDCEFGDGTGGYDIPDEPMTNGDRVRAMTDYELADFLNRVKRPCDNCQLAVFEGACTETLCDDAMENWLKQPVEEKT